MDYYTSKLKRIKIRCVPVVVLPVTEGDRVVYSRVEDLDVLLDSGCFVDVGSGRVMSNLVVVVEMSVCV